MLSRKTKREPLGVLRVHGPDGLKSVSISMPPRKQPGEVRKRAWVNQRIFLGGFVIAACLVIWQGTVSFSSPTIKVKPAEGRDEDHGLLVVTDPRIWVADEDSGLQDFREAVRTASQGKAALLELPTGDTSPIYQLNMRRLSRFYGNKDQSIEKKRLTNEQKGEVRAARVAGSRKFLQKYRQQQISKRQKLGQVNAIPVLPKSMEEVPVISKTMPKLKTSQYVKSIDQLHKKTSFIPTPILSSKLSACHAQANAEYIRAHVNMQRQQELPLLASLVLSPNRREMLVQQSPRMYWTATFSLCDITWRKPGRNRNRIPDIADSNSWKCNNQEGVVIERGCPSGTTVTVQCPQGKGEDVSQISYRNYTYHVRALVRCELSHPLIKGKDTSELEEKRLENLPRTRKPKIVASVIIYQVSVTMLLEWMEYHRLMGVDHFWVYVMEDDADIALPDLSHATYIPWNLNPTMSRTWDKFLFQTAAQVDTLHRARGLGVGGVDWIMYLDLDEFLVIRRRKSDEEGLVSIPEYLQSEIDDSMDAVQVETVSFGSKASSKQPLEFQLNYTWRSVDSFGSTRCKTMVRPSRIDYYNIHWATAPEEASIFKAPTERVWIHHYKKPHKGVFRKELSNKDVTEDVELRDLFAAIVQERVQQTLASWDRNHEGI